MKIYLRYIASIFLASIMSAFEWAYGARRPLPSVLRAHLRATEAAEEHARAQHARMNAKLLELRTRDTTLSESVYLSRVIDHADRRIARLKERHAEITGDLIAAKVTLQARCV